MQQPSDQQLNSNPDSTGLVNNAVIESEIISTGHQPLWNTNATLATYQENWLESNFSSINWLPDDWTPAFELSDTMRLDSLAQSIQPELGQSPSEAQVRHTDFNDSSAIINTTDARRHWVQTDTPRDSLGSEQDSTPQSGRLYVDGDGARLPRVRKVPYQYDDENPEQDYPSDPSTQNAFWFPDLESFHAPTDVSIQHEARISQESYDQVCEAFQSTCVTTNHFSLYHTSNFPPINTLNGYVHLYLLHFQPIFPFIHAASFSAHSAHWLLVLAMGAIGSLYYDGNNNESTRCSLAMLEFLRRALLTFVSIIVFPSLTWAIHSIHIH